MPQSDSVVVATLNHRSEPLAIHRLGRCQRNTVELHDVADGSHLIGLRDVADLIVIKLGVQIILGQALQLLKLGYVPPKPEGMGPVAEAWVPSQSR